jgi:thiol:disulfide interchange protein DsbG
MRPLNSLLPSLMVIALITAFGLTACGKSGSGNVNDEHGGVVNHSDSYSQNSKSSGQLDKAKSLVSSASHSKATADSVFVGPDGMVGIVTETQGGGAKQIVWASPTLEVIFPGDALDKDGNSLNRKALVDQHVYVGGPEMADLIKNKGFVVGKKGPLIGVFMDPNCIYCNKFYKGVMPLVEQGKLRVRFIMVGFLKPTSIPRSVAILASKDPAKALEEDEMKFDEPHEEGGIAPLSGSHADTEKEVAENSALLSKAGPFGTPAMISCQGGKEPIFTSGMPQDIPGFVASLDVNPTYDFCK